jgi:CubicO group peptidase (beta-lactamase class C family)
VCKYLPQFGQDKRKNITIKHLLMMSSGLNWNESASYHNPLKVFGSDIMEAYYGTDLNSLVLSKPCIYPPGLYFDYSSADTQILSMVLATATGMPISEYFEKKIWQMIDAEYNALWNLNDKNGYERAFCCLYATTRDYARLGKLCLHKGQWNGMQIVDSNYINQAITPIKLKDRNDTTQIVDYYGFQFWLLTLNGLNTFYMRGTLGQFVIMIPEKNIVIVRLGKKQGDKLGPHFKQTYTIINESVKMLGD